MKRWIAMVTTAVMFCTLLSGCGGQEEGPGESKEGGAKDTLTVAANGEPTKIDPQSNDEATNHKVAIQMFEPLFIVNSQGEIEGLLAEDWEYQDEKTLTIHLRQGVKFHNGEELKASDVLFTMERANRINPSIAAIVNMIDVENSTADDEYTVTLRLLQPYASLLRHLSHPGTGIVSQKAVEEIGEEDFAHEPLGGTGPFQFESWNPGDSITLKRFEDYWGEKPAITTIVFRYIPESTNRTIELETGAVDIAYEVQVSDIERIESNPDLLMMRAPGLGNTFAKFNPLVEPFQDQRVRLALVKALDVPGIVDAVFFGAGAPSYGMMSSKVWGYNDEYPHYGYDVEEAKQLLADAGYPDGFEITLMVSDNQTRVDMAEIMQNQWSKIGVKANVQVYEIGTFFDHYGKNDFQVCIVGMTTVTADADYGLYGVWHTSATPEGQTPLFSDPEVDKLLDGARSEADDDKRREMYFEVQKILLDFVPIIPLWENEELNACRSNVKGFEVDSAGHHRLWKVHFE